jgi:D-alanyl-lipoteichoic acid acyltransferase DltB (MBOAT superfamily)
MLFNSPEFLLFLPIVFGLYWFVVQRNLKAQNVLLLVASYVFYGWWDWRFLGLIAFSTVVDFMVGIRINETPEKRIKKRWMAVSLLVNLGLLAYFKYANFFIESWVDAWATMGVTMHASSLQVILPVGISFYTFQTLSYSIDIYRGTLKPTRSLVNFAAFVSFFPQLVAGPIERASRLLPQIENKREFKYEEGVAGLRLILWGMFKKVVVADTCAIYANDIFANYTEYSGPTLMLGAVYFAFQIYGDFSGYSDIAIGTAKLFGIQLMTNFKTPYFSRDIAEFWRRWHISLSTWFRDYLYIPLGGSRVGKWKAVRNVFIIFLVSGFWHGANWTFIVWGGIHACLFLPLLLRGTNRRYTSETIGEGRWLPSGRELLGMAWTFTMVCVAWVFFRAESVGEATAYVSKMGILKDWLHFPQKFAYTAFAYLGAMLLGDWLMRNGRMPSWWYATRSLPVRWGFAALSGWLILKNFASQADFIYFQF